MLPLAIISFVLYANVIAADNSTGDGLSYDDLHQLNGSCHPRDTCDGREADDSPGITHPNSCSCHAECSLFGTCCIDSPHRDGSPTNQKCGVVDFPETDFGYYMVQSCPEEEVVLRDLYEDDCLGGLDKYGNIHRISPVTSLETNTTYKNSYCLSCHEGTDNYRFWNYHLLNSSDVYVANYSKLAYNDTDNTWYATSRDEDISIPVKLQFSIPPEITFPVIQCNPNMVTDCPDSWEDDIIRSKCGSYTSLLYKDFGPVYKNAHCALCNSQPLHELFCEPPQ